MRLQWLLQIGGFHWSDIVLYHYMAWFTDVVRVAFSATSGVDAGTVASTSVAPLEKNEKTTYA